MTLTLRRHHKQRNNTSSGFAGLLDTVVYPIALIGPLMTIPQVLTIWVDKQTAGVSLVSWTAYGLTSLFWLCYGLVHQDRAIIFVNAIWVLVICILVLGLVI